MHKDQYQPTVRGRRRPRRRPNRMMGRGDTIIGGSF